MEGREKVSIPGGAPPPFRDENLVVPVALIRGADLLLSGVTVSVHDVAAYILDKLGAMSTWKLQKLVYYSQAWHLVWDEELLFPERIQAWANGPVVFELYDAHRGRFSVSTWPMGNANRLSPCERESVDAVLQSYGGLTGRKLSYLTHSEDPWRDARGSLPPTARSNAEITPEALVDYYGGLDATGAGEPVDDLDWASWEDGE
jgi:uncharacterized phage-associated protein